VISVSVVAVAASVIVMVGASVVGGGIVYALYCSGIVYVLYFVGTYFPVQGCRLVVGCKWSVIC